MAAPSISGLSRLLTNVETNWTSGVAATADAGIPDIETRSEEGVFIKNSVRFRDGSTSVTDGLQYSGYASFASAVDITGQNSILIHLARDTWNSGTESISVALLSGGTTTNYRIYPAPGLEALGVREYQTYILGNDTTLTEGGTFDPADVTGIAVLIDCNRDGSFRISAAISQIIYIDGGITLLGGEIGDKANLSSIFNLATDNSSDAVCDVINEVGNFYGIKCSLTISADLFEETQSGLFFLSNPDQYYISSDYYKFIVDGASVLFTSSQVSSLVNYDETYTSGASETHTLTQVSKFGGGDTTFTESGGNITVSGAYSGRNSITFNGGETVNNPNIDACGLVTIAGALTSPRMTISNPTDDALQFDVEPDETYNIELTGTINLNYGGHTGDFTDLTGLNGGTFTFDALDASTDYTVRVLDLALVSGLDGSNQITSTTGGGTITVEQPPVTFSAPNINNNGFGNVRCRTSFYRRSTFETTDVNTATNEITIAGLDGRISTDTGIRLAGTDLPAPLDAANQYYVHSFSGNDVVLSAEPGGAGSAISLSDVGSGDMVAIATTELDIQLVTSGGYSFDLSAAQSTADVALQSGDFLLFQALDWKGSLQTHTPIRSSKYHEELQQFSATNITTLTELQTYSEHDTFAVQQSTDGYEISQLTVPGSSPTRYQWRVDSSSPGKVQIETEDPDGVLDSELAVLFFQYQQWTTVGIRLFRGQVEAENLNEIVIKSPEIGIDPALTIETFPKTRPLVVTGAGLYREDGVSWIAPGDPIQHQPRSLVAVPIEVETPINLSGPIVNLLHTQTAALTYLTNKVQSLAATLESSGVFSETALANAPSGGSGTAPTVEEIRAEIDSNSTQLAAILTDTGTTLPAQISGLNDLAIADVETALSNYGASTFDGDLSTLATATNLATVDSNVDAIKTKTDQLAFTVANQVDANALTGGGSGGGDDAATIYSYFTALSRADAFKATGFSTFDPSADTVTVGGYASGQSPATLVDLSGVLTEIATVDGNVDTILADTAALARGDSVIDYTTSTFTLFSPGGSSYQVFDLRQSDDSTAATTAQDAVIRRAQ